MAFYNSKHRTGPHQYCVKLDASFQNPNFYINNDFSLCKKYMIDALVQAKQRYKNVAIPFSGGADSTFVVRSYIEALNQNLLNNNDIKVYNFLFELDGKIINDNHQFSIDLVKKEISVEQKKIVLDDLFFSRVVKRFIKEGEGNFENLIQFEAFESMPGVQLCAEGRPHFFRKPWLATDTEFSEKKYIVDVTRSYDTNYRVNLFSLTRELFQSFMIADEVNFSRKTIDKKDFENLSVNDRYRYIKQYHIPKLKIYLHCFPQMEHLNKPKFASLDLVGLRANKHYRQAKNFIWSIYNTKSPVQLHEKEFIFDISDYYNFTWSDYNIIE